MKPGRVTAIVPIVAAIATSSLAQIESPRAPVSIAATASSAETARFQSLLDASAATLASGAMIENLDDLRHDYRQVLVRSGVMSNTDAVIRAVIATTTGVRYAPVAAALNRRHGGRDSPGRLDRRYRGRPVPRLHDHRPPTSCAMGLADAGERSCAVNTLTSPRLRVWKASLARLEDLQTILVGERPVGLVDRSSGY